jgi:hypothetical protein
MKRNLLLSLLFILVTFSVSGGPISLEQAQQNAKSFLSEKQISMKKVRAGSLKLASTLTTAVKTPSYFIFNIGDGDGYLVVSGSDKTQSILGYTDNGKYDVNNAPEGLRDWLAELSTAVKTVDSGKLVSLKKSNAPARIAEKTITKNVVPVLVQSKWNQGSPYNLLCPTYIKTLNDDGTKKTTPEKGTCASGCVATAMAQVMYFWKWPLNPTATIDSYSYNFENKSYTLDALPATTFAWDNMTDTYDSKSSTESNNAVATLMEYAGHSVNMGYGPSSGAGVDRIAPALKNKFGYDSNCHFEGHDNFTYQEWEDMIYSEIAAGRPVLMNAGISTGGAHEFVCDGYDGNGYYHINWGWGGSDNGYFILTVMQPGEQGIEGSTSSDGFSLGQGIVIGIQPPTGQPTAAEIVRCRVSDFTLPSGTATCNYNRRTSGLFYPSFKFKTGTSMSKAYSFDLTFGVYDANGKLLTVCDKVIENFSITPGYWGPDETYSPTFGAGLADGRYFLKALCRKYGKTEWTKAELSDNNYIIADINGKKLTITACPHIDVTVDTLEIIGNGNVSSEQKVKATLTNNSVDYYNEIYLLDGVQWVSGNCVNLPAGKTTDIYFKYTPKTSGEHILALSTRKEAEGIFYKDTINISEKQTTSLTITMNPENEVLSIGGEKCIYGNQIIMDVAVTNKGTNTYNSYVDFSPWEISGAYYWMKGSTRKFIKLLPGETTNLVYVLDDLDYEGIYNFHINTNGGGYANCGDFKFKEGYLYWTADGKKYATRSSRSTHLAVTKDMVAIYVPSMSSNAAKLSFESANVVNPNLIVYFKDSTDIDSTSLEIYKKYIKNSVYGSESESITLNLDSDVYIPMDFTAKTIKCTHAVPSATVSAKSFEAAASSNSVYGTFVIPFSPSSITADGTAIDWFHSSTDTNKGLAIKEFSAIEGDKLYFNYVDKIVANRPYFVSYAGTINGSKFNQCGKTLTFNATNADIKANGAISTYSTDYKFIGTTSTDSLANIYTLDANGQSFSKQTKATINPFSAYFVANNTSAAELEKLFIVDEGTTTGIKNINRDADDSQALTIYNVSGSSVGKTTAGNIKASLEKLPRGVYVISGKKYVVR